MHFSYHAPDAIVIGNGPDPIDFAEPQRLDGFLLRGILCDHTPHKLYLDHHHNLLSLDQERSASQFPHMLCTARERRPANVARSTL